MNTMLKNTVGSLSVSKGHVDAIVSNIRIAVLDRNFVVTWMNDKFCALTQYEKQELIGKPLDELSLVSLSPEYFNAIRSVISGGDAWIGEVRSITKTGSTIWVKINILPVRHGEDAIGSYLLFVNDISATKLALEKEQIALESMKKSEARYRAVVENQSDIMSLCKADLTRLFVNEGFCQFMGVSEEKLIGKGAREFPLKGLPYYIYDNVKRLTMNSPEISGVFELENFIGRKVWLSLLFKGIFDPEGRLYEVLTIGRDVTELKTAELNKGRYIEDLERMAHMTSHNVRAPISEMQGFLELLRINAIHTVEWKMVLDHFKKSIDKLDSCTRELGAFIYQSQMSR